MAVEGRSIELHKRNFLEFLESESHEGRYIDKIRQCIDEKKFRLIVNINAVRNHDSALAAA